jgi:hypothetical protein
MDDADQLLAALAGTRFGPVEFGALRDGVLRAESGGVTVRIFVDGPTLVAVGDAAPGAHATDWANALVQVDDEAGGAKVRVWAVACTPGEVARAAHIAASAAASGRGSAVAAGASDDAPMRSPVAVAPEALPGDVEQAVGLLALSCSDDLAQPLRELLLGARAQVLLSRPQLDQLTGAVLGDVMVFSVGAGGRGGVSINAVLPSGRAADVEVRIDASGIHIDPASEGAEVRAALDRVNEVLGARGLRVASIAGTGDHVVVATEPLP